ncbi:MAG: hypothetical protein ACC656_06465, partial [Candidatus Heimdallarchaeota archaeon]
RNATKICINMNIFKKFKLYVIYRKLIITFKNELLNKFNIRTDQIKRMYTVINVPDETQIYGEENSGRLTENFLKQWLANLDSYLFEKGIKEYSEVQEITPIDKQNFLIIIKYKYLKIDNWIWMFTIILATTFITSLVVLLIKLLFYTNG